MNSVSLTQHAQRRKQQRGISELQIELIQAFGDDHYQKGGCTLSFVSEKRIRQLRDAIDKLANVAIIKSPFESAITVMHIDQRVLKTNYIS